MKFLDKIICARKNKNKKKFFDIRISTQKIDKTNSQNYQFINLPQYSEKSKKKKIKKEKNSGLNQYKTQFSYGKIAKFAFVSCVLILIIPSFILIQKGLEIKGKILGVNISSREQLNLVQKVISEMDLEKFSIAVKGLRDISKTAPIASEALGYSYPKKYLLIFQNNQELRATGGFIGTYGILDIDSGKIKNFFIDGIYNPDGQLTKHIIPPEPIKKISAAWSMHDANWFLDWPTSAEKIVSFYEKSGGATPDGVIALTPVIIEKILKITGSIEISEYNLIVTSDNFIEIIQKQTKEKDDKELNKHKKILANFAPKLMEKIYALEREKMIETLKAVEECLKEKHILIFSFDQKIQNFILENGWGGQILKTGKDYLSVVHSNINGYKTDGVINEKIEHFSEIGQDGTIINTVVITRNHLGGNSNYEWYNKVNCDWMRVYVPRGSELLEVSGHTIEKNQTIKEGFDFSFFKEDPLISKIESTIRVHENSGTKIFEESGKTVFGNWVFVSPGKSVTVIYKYKLPFKIDFLNEINSYSLLVQKQPGSAGSKFISDIKIPAGLEIIWKHPEPARNASRSVAGGQQLTTGNDLNTDRFYGMVFQKIKAN